MKDKFRFKTNVYDYYTAKVVGDTVIVSWTLDSGKAGSTTLSRDAAETAIVTGVWTILDDPIQDLQSFNFYCNNDKDLIYHAQECEDGSFIVSWTDGGRVVDTRYCASMAREAIKGGDWIKIEETDDTVQIADEPSQLETLRLQSKNTKCWFTIADGKFLVQNGSVDYWCDNEKDLFEIISMVEKLDEFADK